MPRSRKTDAPLFRRTDSPYWWTWVYEGKRRVKLSTKCTDRKAALARAAELQRETVSPRNPYSDETVADALLAFLDAPVQRAASTAEIYSIRAANVGDSIGGVRLADLSREHVEGFVAGRRAAVRTIRGELTILSQAIRLARQRGRAAPDPAILQVPVPGVITPKERNLTRAEYDSLMEELRPHWAEWVRVAVYTGARLEEVNALTWDGVDLARGVLHIQGKKTDRSDRYIPIAQPLIEWLTMQRNRNGPLVRPMKGQTRALTGPCWRAGIPRCTPHDFRRTFASWLLQDGVSERDIADLLGHTTTTLTRMVYAKTSMDRLRLAVDRLR